MINLIDGAFVLKNMSSKQLFLSIKIDLEYEINVSLQADIKNVYKDRSRSSEGVFIPNFKILRHLKVHWF